MAQDSQNQLQPSTPDCPVPQAGLRRTGCSRESAGRVAKNHRTVRCVVSAAPKSFSDELVALGETKKRRG
jgi:hypothetical protein